MPPKQNTVALWSYCWNKLLLLYYRNALPRVKILRFISLSTSSRLWILKKWFIKSNSWQNTTKQNQHFENTKISTLTLDIRILDGFMNISASSNCPPIPSNTPLLKKKKNKNPKPATIEPKKRQKFEDSVPLEIILVLQVIHENTVSVNIDALEISFLL